MIRTITISAVILTSTALAQEAPSKKAHEAAKKIFSTYCTTCHGSKGKGDGIAAAALQPRPRRMGDAAWQLATTDKRIEKVIMKGGQSVGLSPTMAPAASWFRGKPKGTLKAMVRLVRGFGAASPYLRHRAVFETKLEKPAPAPQEFSKLSSSVDLMTIEYPSGSRMLAAQVHAPKKLRKQRRGAIIFFHGGFALGNGDLKDVQPFIDAGYVVMLPTLRGENGNAGNFEMFVGEVDDAKAAAVWLSKQSYVDPTRIYAFGHSIGGGVAAMLSLLDGVPVKLTGSSGGLYAPKMLAAWEEILPFDPKTEKELMMRTLHGNIDSMLLPHIAYLGRKDAFSASIAKLKKEIMEKNISEPRIEIHLLPGDHFSSLAPAMEDFIKQIESKK